MAKGTIALSDPYWGLVWLLRRFLPVSLQLRLARRARQYTARFRPERTAEVSARVQTILTPRVGNIDAEAIARRNALLMSEPRFLSELLDSTGGAKARQYPIRGIDTLDKALDDGKGAILATAHFGYATLLRQILDAAGYNVWEVIARTSRRRSAHRKRFNKFSRFRQYLFRSLYGRPPHETVEKQLFADFNVRAHLEVLKRNGILLIAADGLNGSGIVFVDFLGYKLPFVTGYVSIALRSGAPILPVFAIDSKTGLGVEVVIEEPLALETTGDRRRDLSDAVEAFVRKYESVVLAYPHLFQFWTGNWFERRLAYDKKPGERY